MPKRIVSFVLSLAMALTLMPWMSMDVKAEDGTCECSNHTYFIDGDTITINGSEPITSSCGFNSSSSVPQGKNVIIGDGITEVGDCAFEMCEIKSITFGSSVEKIGDTICYANEKLIVTFTSVVNNIGNYAFDGCDEGTLNLPADWPETDLPNEDGNWHDGTFPSYTPPTPPTKYEIILQDNGNGCADSRPEYEAVEGADVTITANAYQDYVFDKWESSDITIPDTAGSEYTFTMPAKNVTVKAVFKAAHTHDWQYSATGNKLEAYCANAGCPSGTDATHKVSLTLTASSANYSGSAVSATLSGGTEWTSAGLELPAIVYYTNEDCAEAHKTTQGTAGDGSTSGASAVGGAPVNVGSYWATITVGTKISKIAFSIIDPSASYTVSFDANGGTGTHSDATGISGTYTLPTSTTFTAPTGKKFKGWSTSASGSIVTGSIDVTGNTTLYAIWEAEDDGNIEIEGQKGSSIETDKKKLVEAINEITEADLDKDIKVVLEISDDKDASAETKEKAESSFAGYKLGKAFDADLILYVNNVSRGKATLNKAITMTVQIPSDIWSSDREYKLLHNHNGTVSVINGKTSNKKFTFDIEDFSEFAFLYRTRSAEDKEEEQRCHHDYAWMVIQKPTMTTDGKIAHKCVKCGHIDSDYPIQPVSAYKYASDEAVKQIQNASQGATISIDYGVFNTFPKYLLEAIQARTDLTITFKYKVGKIVYERTVKPNTELPTELPDYAGTLFLDAYFEESILKEMAY